MTTLTARKGRGEQNPAYEGRPNFFFSHKPKYAMSNPASHSIVICAMCGGEMQRGRVSVGQTVSGFLAAGMALPHLFFESDSGGKTSVFGWRDHDAAAHRCPGCGVVMLQGRRE